MYFFHTEADRIAMLQAIGEASVSELLDAQVPEVARLDGPLHLPPAQTEMELEQSLRHAAARNVSASSHVCFLGGGAYDHFIPATVDALSARGEFFTSYTPYQAEVSQGNLQVMFEYETLMTQLTGLDVSNASLYDGGSAAVEAVLMALAIKRERRRVVTSAAVHPEYRQILQTYLQGLDCELVIVPLDSEGGSSALGAAIDDRTACVLLQHPNFLGHLEAVPQICSVAKQHGALTIQVFDPISLGMLKRPGELGVDIAVAEGQCLGNPLSFGGPYLGIIACQEALVRRMPGRIAGQTTDRRGKRCWVLTLQTREQHIRRDKATSNICSNQTLLALRATIYLSLQGPRGMRETAEHCYRKTQYARDRVLQHSRYTTPFAGPTFREFVVRDSAGMVPKLLADMLQHRFLAGVPLGQWYPELDDCFLVAVTERRTRPEIDAFVETLGSAVMSGVFANA